MYTVSSEIYKEVDYEQVRTKGNNVISKFKFHYPGVVVDNDGDLDVRQHRVGVIELEHSTATELKLVGLQVWRGALLLADYMFANRDELKTKTIMELGAGMGLTSIAAAIHNSGKTYCTDVDLGCILQLIRSNVKRNAALLSGEIKVLEYDFLRNPSEYSSELISAIDDSDVVLAADVIYDDTLTDAFIAVIDQIFARGVQTSRAKSIYVALEKRYVFTLEDCNSVAPMYEYFLKQTSKKPWFFENVPLDFPQFFAYDRCKQLVLIRITNRA
ncbi:methyltransferase-like protein 22 [Scaptodrosophila lebanonensis]|uniref:Methyltransferase-like protein 22 n=1 Tax=Drosophila lebanonensis TaxID=7225 RepID=A0A6J2UB72_DROLE|nr:methyltransferase-like protein 22 [Scaptodrosophila lebanonensis]